ncbi:MAG: hypothetical protein H6702_22330 [Myxococcales bacterium]|nr:hypothetical protein [Myxococcales bacterium]
MRPGSVDFEQAREGLLRWYAMADRAGAERFARWAVPKARWMAERSGAQDPEDAAQIALERLLDRGALRGQNAHTEAGLTQMLDWRIRDAADAQRRRHRRQTGLTQTVQNPKDNTEAERETVDAEHIAMLEATRHAEPAHQERRVRWVESALAGLTPTERQALLAYHWNSLKGLSTEADVAGFTAASGRPPLEIQGLLVQVVDGEFRTSIRVLFSDTRLEAAFETCQNTYQRRRRRAEQRLSEAAKAAGGGR